MRALLAFLFACGSSTLPPKSDRIVRDEPPPVHVVVADASVAGPAPPSRAMTLEAMIAIGDVTTAEVTKRLEADAGRIVACVAPNGPTTTELSLMIVDDTIGFRSAWQGGAPVRPSCLEPIFSNTPPNVRSTSTSVYVVVKAAAPGETAPAAPPPPDRLKEFQRMFCDLETLSGADKLGTDKKRETMQTWARVNIRHPAPFELARQVGKQAPVDVVHFLEKSLRAEGITKCALQRW